MFDLPERPVHGLVERAIEVAKQFHPVEMLLLNFVELQLHPGRELHVHDLWKSLDELVGHDRPKHRGVKPAIDLLNVFAILNSLDDARVGAGPTDPKLLQGLDQAGLCEPRRGLCEMLRRQHIDWR